jgi:hypothetical protein
MSLLGLIASQVASQFKQLKKPEEFIQSVISEQCRTEYLEFVEGKRTELSQGCRDEVAGAAYLYAAGIYLMLRPLAAVARAYKLAYNLFVEEKVK